MNPTGRTSVFTAWRLVGGAALLAWVFLLVKYFGVVQAAEASSCGSKTAKPATVPKGAATAR